MRIGKLAVWTLGLMVSLNFASLGEAVMDVAIEDDGMLKVNGERVFILGLYEYPDDDAVLEEAVDAGFNLVQARSEAQLDRLAELGAWAWMNTGGDINLSQNTADRLASLEAMVEEKGQHPALLVWEVPDEALWNNWYPATQWRRGTELSELQDLASGQEPPVDISTELSEIRRFYSQARYREGEDLANALWEDLGATSPRPDVRMSEAEANALEMAEGMLAGYEYLAELDPMRPVWMNHAPRNMRKHLALFNEAADIVGCDIYPVPQSYRVTHSDLAEQSMAAVGAYTRRMQKTAPGKPVWMVLQGFGWGDIQPDQPEDIREELRRPTPDETRFMAWDAIVHGARSILYWGTHAVEKDAEFWDELLAVVAELESLQPVLSAPEIPVEVEVEYHNVFYSMDRGIKAMVKDTPDGPCLILVNTFPGSVQFTLHGLDALEGMHLEDFYTDQEAQIESGKLHGYISGQSVQLYQPVQ